MAGYDLQDYFDEYREEEVIIAQSLDTTPEVPLVTGFDLLLYAYTTVKFEIGFSSEHAMILFFDHTQY